MKRAVTIYSGILSCLLLIFVNAISCGAQMYRVSLKDDIDSKLLATSSQDPTSELYGIHSPRGWNSLPINIRTGTTLTAEQISSIKAAMHTWEWAVGKQLFNLVGPHEGVDGNNFPTLYSSLGDMVNGTYLLTAWDKTGKKDTVLATTVWQNATQDATLIITSDIKYNDKFYVFGDSQEIIAEPGREVVDLESLSLHELGHVLGLAHVDEEVDRYSVMNPSLYIGEGFTSRKLSKGDIQRLQKIYGCVGTACDIDKLIEEQEYNERKIARARSVTPATSAAELEIN